MAAKGNQVPGNGGSVVVIFGRNGLVMPRATTRTRSLLEITHCTYMDDMSIIPSHWDTQIIYIEKCVKVEEIRGRV